jgi:threonine synthase
VRAYRAGARSADPPPDPHTIASGLRVPRAPADFMIHDLIRASGGSALAAEEEGLTGWMRMTCRLEGISLCPESAACVGALDAALREGLVRPDEEVVIFNTAAAQKYVEVMETRLPLLRRGEPVDWERVAGPAEPEHKSFIHRALR